jgi:hypothetical protein
MTKIIVYTCLVGGYSDLQPPPAELLSKYEFIAFSDKPISISGWQTRLLENSSKESNRRKAKKPKIQPWNYIDAEISVWIDANIIIQPTKLNEAVTAFLLSEKSIGLFAHNKRNNLDAEFRDVIARLKDDTKILARQRDKYKGLVNYRDLPLYHGAVIFRRHGCMKLRKAMSDWQSEIDNFSARDQVSLPVVLQPIAADNLFIFPNMTTSDIVQQLPHLKYENEAGSRTLHEKVKWWIIKGVYRVLTNRLVVKIKHRIKRTV